MRSFAEIEAIAAERKGGLDALHALIPDPLDPADLIAIPEDRWLATFSRAVFNAGFNWKVIAAKWDGFEAAFDGFDVNRCAFMNDETFDALLGDTRIVRNGAKIAAVRDNAIWLSELRAEGGVGQVIGTWPAQDFAGLLAMIGKNGSRLGGTTAQYALRSLGRDGYVLSADVIARLTAEGVIDKPPTSKRAMAAVQGAFNTWMDESGRSLTAISRTLAMSL